MLHICVRPAGTEGRIENLLASPVFKIPPELRPVAAPIASRAFVSYLTGDEKLLPHEQQKIDYLKNILPEPDYTITVITSLWTDLEPKDIKWHIKLSER